MQKRWTIRNTDEAGVAALQTSLRIHKSICKMLVQRGINTFEKAKSWFRPQLSDLHSPWLMKDMNIAVLRIKNAMASNENILVFGDYDVDGTTAVA